MGFHRTRQPDALDRTQVTALIMEFVHEAEIAHVLAVQDPFGVDHDCTNPAGHGAITSCGETVCPHCAKVFWR